MIARVFYSAAVALSVATATAVPAGADPSNYGVLSCNCEVPALSTGGPTAREQIDAGIAHGLSELPNFGR